MLRKPNLDIPALIDFEKKVTSEIVNTTRKVIGLIDEQIGTLPDALVEFFDNKVNTETDENSNLFSGYYPDDNWNSNDAVEIFNDSDVKHLNERFNLNLTDLDYCAAFGCWMISNASLELISVVCYDFPELDDSFKHATHFSDFDSGLYLAFDKTGEDLNFRFGGGEWTLHLASLSRIFPEFKESYSKLLSNEALFLLDRPRCIDHSLSGQLYFSERTITINDNDFNDYLSSLQGPIENNLTTVNLLLSQFNDYDLYGKTIPDDYDFFRNLTNSLRQRPFELVAARLGAEKSDSITTIFDRLEHICNVLGEDVSDAMAIAEPITHAYFKEKSLLDHLDEYVKFSQHPLTQNLPNLFEYLNYTKDDIDDCYQSLSLASSIDKHIQENPLHDEPNSRIKDVHLGLNNAL